MYLKIITDEQTDQLKCRSTQFNDWNVSTDIYGKPYWFSDHCRSWSYTFIVWDCEDKVSNFVWCHGPSCHTYATTDRVRGSKGSKVLRTRKVKQHEGYQLGTSFYNWFCSMTCYNEFANTYVEQIIRIAPRPTPLETPIEDPKKETTNYSYGSYTRTIIKKIDNESNVG